VRGPNYFLIITLVGLLFSTPITKAADTIQLSKDYINNLGITLGKLEAVKQIPILTAPAKITIPASHEYIVSASQVGIINKLIAVIGDKVKKGDVLAQLNSPDLLSMQRLYLKAVNELELASFSYQRDKKLIAEGIIADRRWQETQSQYNAFLSAVNEQKQLLELAGVTSSELEHLSKTRQLSGLLNIHAPISGIVIDRMVAAGERVDILAPLYRIGNLEELWLEINIPPERSAGIKVGDQVLIENTPITAQIILVGQSVNASNQTLLVRALINGNQTYVRAGQTINAQIVKRIEDGYKVPNTAIIQHEGKSFIFILTQDGFNVSPVTVIGKQGNESIISGSLTGDEELAIKGTVALKAKWLGLGSAE
jgi:cobalt-zinc-cadmium efflux system membrane fusion protein